MFILPEEFARGIEQRFGPSGAAWLHDLRTRLAECERRWDLQPDHPFHPLPLHYVCPVTRADGSRAVIKAYYPTGEFLHEAAALRVFAGKGAVQLLDWDAGTECLLLERLEPGMALRSVADDAAATRIAAQVARRLWSAPPVDHQFPSIGDWGTGFAWLRQRYGGGTGPLPEQLTTRAERLFFELQATSAPAVLLHGDLHHDNIRSAQREPWLAIDPKGVVGEPAYEVGAWLRNWLPDLVELPDPAAVSRKRLLIFSEALELAPQRLRDWGTAQAILSAIWTIQDGGDDIQSVVTCASVLDSIRF